jgi:hypothetical protein
MNPVLVPQCERASRPPPRRRRFGEVSPELSVGGSALAKRRAREPGSPRGEDPRTKLVRFPAVERQPVREVGEMLAQNQTPAVKP